jgi:hypothetical protein
MSNCPEHTVSLQSRPQYELADILRHYLPKFLKTHHISIRQHKILHDIQICRTINCGGHLEVCDHCHYMQPAYNSCHNRHCPKCQGIARRRWVAARLKELLPVPYYHAVFTLPHRLNGLTLYNKRLIYQLFYQATAYTLLKFGHDPKFLGAQLGFIAVLHTWGKGLSYHVHWHFIISGGGLTKDGQWQALPYSDKYLFDVKAMSKVVRARFIKILRNAYAAGKITIPDSQEELESPVMFEYFLNDVASDKWINYTQPPFGGPAQVLKYIGRYTHRVAISNQRIVDIENGQICLSVKNYKKGGILEEISLSAEEFIRRFLCHILPRNFRKIRYGGFMAQSIRADKLKLIRGILLETVDNIDGDGLELNSELLHDEYELINICPKCQIGRMRIIAITLDEIYWDRLIYSNSS